MDFGTLDKVKVLSPEAAAVVKWAIRLEGVLHHIEAHSDGYTVERMRRIAHDAIYREDDASLRAPEKEGA